MTALATSWKLAVSVQHGQVGKFKVLDLLECSVGAWSGWQGLQICNILQWPDLLYFQDSWNPVQIGVAGQHLASESALGCFHLACCSQQVAAWTGCKFKVLDLLDSARLEFGQVGRGCRFATFCTGRMFCNQDLQLDLCADSAWAGGQEWPDLFCLQDLQLEHIGVAGQPLASELGWFDQCSWCFQLQGLQCWTLDLQCCNLAR